MSHIFNIDNMNDFNEKLNIDDLYEKKKNYDLSKLDIFNKLLNRVHTKIKTTSRQKTDCPYCWFAVPEVMIGVPKYDQGACISYIMDKLISNGFAVKYIHPSVILISWKHWIPTYVRNEIKKKTGIVVDAYGNILNKKDEEQADENFSDILQLSNQKINSTSKEPKNKVNDKKFKPIQDYKPLGNLIYNEELFSRLENKLNN